MRVGSTVILVTALCATFAAVADVAPADASRGAAAADSAANPAMDGLMPARTINHVVIVYGERALFEASAADLDAHSATTHATPPPSPSPVRQSCG